MGIKTALGTLLRMTYSVWEDLPPNGSSLPEWFPLNTADGSAAEIQLVLLHVWLPLHRLLSKSQTPRSIPLHQGGTAVGHQLNFQL